MQNQAGNRNEDNVEDTFLERPFSDVCKGVRGEKGTPVIIDVAEDYIRVSEDLSVTVTSTDKENPVSKTYSDDELITEYEKAAGENEHTIIYILSVELEEFTVSVPENVFFDGDGIGNAAYASELPREDLGINSKTIASDEIISRTDTVKLTFDYPVDFMFDGTLVAENTRECTVETDKQNEHKATVVKNGTVSDF